MSDSCIIPLLHDYNIKEVKLHKYKLKHDDNFGKKFDVKKSDWNHIRNFVQCCHISFHTMSLRMELKGPMMNSYLNKCLLDNVLDKWQSVTLHKDDQTVEII